MTSEDPIAPDPSGPLAFLAGGGRATALILAHDWSAHPLGPPQGWPAILKSSISLVLNSPESMILAWGEELSFFFNEAYFPLLGPRLDRAMGAPFREIWADAWEQARPIIADAFAGRSQRYTDLPWKLGTDRGRADTWFSFSYSRILDPAGQVAGLFILTTETTEKVLADEALRASEARYRALFEKWSGLFANLKEGFILGRVVRDDAGRVVDWTYEEVNDAWYDVVGVERGSVAGRTIREVLPGIEDVWIDEFARVVDHGETLRFTRRVGQLGRWFDGVGQPAGNDRFTAIFSDVTERVERQRRQAAVAALNDVLGDTEDLATLSAAASEILGETLAVELVGYGDVDADAETITVDADWTDRGVRSLAGTLRLRDFGSYADALRRGETVVVADCRSDPRTAGHAAALEARHARAFVNVPVLERGRFVALLYVSTATPRGWSAADVEFVQDFAGRIRQAVERFRAERQQAVLNAEIAHRLKNSLAMVQSIASQTFKGSVDRATLNSFARRLTALGTAHDALLGKAMEGADLSTVIRKTLDAAGAGDRCSTQGPPVQLGPRSALATTMLVHELATNAMKHGALAADGRVAIAWAVEQDAGGARFHLDWRETGGPPALPPTRAGFGSRLIALGLVGSGGSDLRYGDEGFAATFSASIAELARS